MRKLDCSAARAAYELSPITAVFSKLQIEAEVCKHPQRRIASSKRSYLHLVTHSLNMFSYLRFWGRSVHRKIILQAAIRRHVLSVTCFPAVNLAGDSDKCRIAYAHTIGRKPECRKNALDLLQEPTNDPNENRKLRKTRLKTRADKCLQYSENNRWCCFPAVTYWGSCHEHELWQAVFSILN